MSKIIRLDHVFRRIRSIIRNFYALTRAAPQELAYLPWALAKQWLCKLSAPANEATKDFVLSLDKVPTKSFREQDIGYLFPPIYPATPTGTPLRIASILDEFSDHGFRYEADLVRVRPEDWRDQIEEERPELLLIESAWRGNDGSWRKKIEHCTTVVGNPLLDLVAYCRSRDIPVVMWNKEDPPNFANFKDLAPLSDFVFTSDFESIDRYKDLLGHDRIAAMPFAIQPKIHNPIGKRDHPCLEACFAGTWYNHKHPDRQALLPRILDAAKHRNLHIFDRRAQSANPTYRFPRRFRPFLHDPLPYSQMLQAYRDFRLFLNVNSVIDSSTMFARRVLEVLACQTNVVSTPSIGVERMLGGIVQVADTMEELKWGVDSLLDDRYERLRRAHLGWRKVTREHTYRHRLSSIADAIGISLPAELTDKPKVSLVVRHHSDGDLTALQECVYKQTYGNLEVLFLEGPGIESQARVRQLMGNRAGGKLLQKSSVISTEIPKFDLIAAEATGELITLFDSRDRYGPELIWDLVSSLSYANSDLVTKLGHYTCDAGSELARPVNFDSLFQHVSVAAPRIFMARREWLRNKTMWKINSDRMLVPNKDANQAGTVLSVDPFNYIRDGLKGSIFLKKSTSDSIKIRDALV